MRRLAPLALLGLLAGCEYGGEVGHAGSYGFAAGAEPPATAVRPLRALLVIESDARSDRTLFYLFEGELGAAGVGLSDLRDLDRDAGRFGMRFDPPPSAYASSSSRETASDDAPSLDVDGTRVAFQSISSAELAAVGAARFAPSLATGLGGVRVGFAAWASAAPFARAAVATVAGGLEPAFELDPATPTAAQVGPELRIAPGELQHVDYLEVDLFQSRVRVADAAELEATLGITLHPASAYAAHHETLASAASQGCWSASRPLHARVTQVARDYAVFDAGDAAVVQRRLDEIELDPELWADTTAEIQPAAYCDAFAD